jgi:hypothetical protein
MKTKLIRSMLLLGAAIVTTGCARPGEIGWSPAYTGDERGKIIARNWDYEGKQIVDDFDHFMLLQPATRLTIWNVQ